MNRRQRKPEGTIVSDETRYMQRTKRTTSRKRLCESRSKTGQIRSLSSLKRLKQYGRQS